MSLPLDSASPAMQMRCIHCGLEQYAPAIWSISHGEHPCCWCGQMSKPMTEEEYRKAHLDRMTNRERSPVANPTQTPKL